MGSMLFTLFIVHKLECVPRIEALSYSSYFLVRKHSFPRPILIKLYTVVIYKFNKLQCLLLQPGLIFASKARACPSGARFRCYLLGKALSFYIMLERFERDKHSSLSGLITSEKNSFITLTLSFILHR